MMTQVKTTQVLSIIATVRSQILSFICKNYM